MLTPLSIPETSKHQSPFRYGKRVDHRSCKHGVEESQPEHPEIQVRIPLNCFTCA